MSIAAKWRLRPKDANTLDATFRISREERLYEWQTVAANETWRVAGYPVSRLMIRRCRPITEFTSEELGRLVSHLDGLAPILKNGGEAGKYLDFLIQELHREANTLGSKSTMLELTRISVDMKVLIEQMREQVQNIERFFRRLMPPQLASESNPAFGGTRIGAASLLGNGRPH